MIRPWPDRPAPWHRVLRLLLPPLCPGCGGATDLRSAVCGRCMRELNRSAALRADPPEGIARIVSCAPHEGVARGLLVAWKFRGLTALEDLICGYVADLAGPAENGVLVVPVPPNPIRGRLRGFDPARAMADRIGSVLPAERPRPDVLIRRGAGHQRGRGRAGRLSDPPDIRPAGPQSDLEGRPVLLVDDVMTTGATLTAAASALRVAGAGTIRAITFTRRL